MDISPKGGKSYEIVVRLSVVAPEDEGEPCATWDELVTALELAVADVTEFDVDAETHADGVELWTVDGANVVEIDGSMRW